MRSHRRAPRLPLVVVGLALGAMTSCGTASVWSDGHPGAVRVDADYYASEYGVRVGSGSGTRSRAW